MTAVVDVRERVPCFLPENGGCDLREFLKVGTSYSYDFRIDFPTSFNRPSLQCERKRFGDGVASFLDNDKIARQLSYCHVLFLEFDPEDIIATMTRYEGESRDPVGRFMKRVARMSSNEGEYAKLWVVPTLGPQGTMSAIRYIESGKATRP